ncbi:UPF0158 family protein [Pontibacter sp. G13]|uniref:UPF0158 family protein n=1 Tax=Pontibacter sp. G13 TaxID=3074898 RepID=UPI00288B9311|nr:UPF0158 family protein [Pontibacter sp. G13]WNJ19261.1 UPF0158 family protein [Pontibacter sp. G13]
MKITEQLTKQLAEFLSAGNICYIHRQTGEVKYFPDTGGYDLADIDEELAEEFKEVEQEIDQYHELKPMPSRDSFKIMEGFAETLPGGELKSALEQALSNRKPFAHFKALIDHSPMRQEWFDFKEKAELEWVADELKWLHEED